MLWLFQGKNLIPGITRRRHGRVWGWKDRTDSWRISSLKGVDFLRAILLFFQQIFNRFCYFQDPVLCARLQGWIRWAPILSLEMEYLELLDGWVDGWMDIWMGLKFIPVSMFVSFSGPRLCQEALNISLSASSLISFLTNPSWAQVLPSLHTLAPAQLLWVMTGCEGFQICLKLATLIAAHCNPGWDQPFLCFVPGNNNDQTCCVSWESTPCQALSRVLHTYLTSWYDRLRPGPDFLFDLRQVICFIKNLTFLNNKFSVC